MARKKRSRPDPSPGVAYPPQGPGPGGSPPEALYGVRGLAAGGYARGLTPGGYPRAVYAGYPGGPPPGHGGHTLWQYTESGWVLKKAAGAPGSAAGPPPRSPGAFVGEIRKVSGPPPALAFGVQGPYPLEHVYPAGPAAE